MKKIVISSITAMGVFLTPMAVFADDYDEFKAKAEAQYAQFKNESEKRYKDFRDKANNEYADFMKNPWAYFNKQKEIAPPPEPSPEPIVISDDDRNKGQNNRPIKIDTVVQIPVVPVQPTPIVPIKETPITRPISNINITFFGTEIKTRSPELDGFKILGRREADFAEAWRKLATDATNNLLVDCLRTRKEKALCDWAYVLMLQQLSNKMFGEKTNESALMSGFLLNQSGYKVRYGLDSNINKLYMLVAVDGYIYNAIYYQVDGSKLYPVGEQPSGNLQICNFYYPKERPVSLAISTDQKFSIVPSEPRNVTAHNYPNIKLSLSTNKNLIDFFNIYPEACLNDSPYTKWAIYANTPLSSYVKDQLYPILRRAITGKSEKDAANILINVAQSFPYGYDDKIWGKDRAFFTEESWFYPYSDCEDHAIHFSRLVRDLMGLDVVLIYYPGHLASAVAFNESIPGDYIIENGKRYLVCDPTIFYAPIGMTMKGMDNGEAILIHLKP